MARPEFTPEGVEVRTFDEIFNSIADQMRAIYGNDINLSQDTPDGQQVAIYAKEILDLETFGLDLYGEFDPDFARGELLNKIIKLIGIDRRPATQSTVDVDIVTDQALTLLAGYTVQDDNGENWITTSDLNLALGSNSVSMVSEQYAAIQAEPNTITEPVTIVLGVVSVTNPLAATVGTDEETDEDLRVRRNRSLENAAYSTVGGLIAKLGEVDNVTDVIVYENDADVTDADSIPAHGIWAVIEGGTQADIAETMAKNKTSGTAMKGSITETYIEEILLPNGNTIFKAHDMQFDRPVIVDVYVTLDVTCKSVGCTIDTALIAQKIAEEDFTIGEEMLATALYSAVYQAGTNFIASDLQISDDNITFTDQSLPGVNGQKFSIDTLNITVTEI